MISKTAAFKSSLFSETRRSRVSAPKKGLELVRNHSETPLNTFRLTISGSMLFGLQEHCLGVAAEMCRFVWLCSIAGPFRRAMAVFKFSLFSGNMSQPRECPQKGLELVWNHSETPSGSPSQALCSFGYKSNAFELPQRCEEFVWLCSIARPFQRAMAVFKFSLFSGNMSSKPRERVSAPQKDLKLVWNHSSSSPSQTLGSFSYKSIA